MPQLKAEQLQLNLFHTLWQGHVGGNCRQIIWGFDTVDITATKIPLCGIGITVLVYLEKKAACNFHPFGAFTAKLILSL